jgi:Icc-related predicted phosphoesterase
MIRVAAAADVHFDRNSAGKLKRHFSGLDQRADMLLLGGDLTQTGHVEEAAVLAEDLRQCPVPIVAVLGNHDYHVNQVDALCGILRKAGVNVLLRDTLILEVRDLKVGIVGLKGFGGGFVNACGSDFGEPEMKAFVQYTKRSAANLKSGLESLKTDYKIALLHYAPIHETLLGEKKEIYPFLGSYLLGQAIDEAGADIVFHGHAHRGIEKGLTPGGIPVRNVALPVIRHAFNIYTLNKDGSLLAHAGPDAQLEAHQHHSEPNMGLENPSLH